MLKKSFRFRFRRNETKKNSSNEHSVDHQSPILKKFVDRFRYNDAQSRENRQSIDADLWWLKGFRLVFLDQQKNNDDRFFSFHLDELQTTQNSSVEQSNCKSSELVEVCWNEKKETEIFEQKKNWIEFC